MWLPVLESPKPTWLEADICQKEGDGINHTKCFRDITAVNSQNNSLR